MRRQWTSKWRGSRGKGCGRSMWNWSHRLTNTCYCPAWTGCWSTWLITNWWWCSRLNISSSTCTNSLNWLIKLECSQGLWWAVFTDTPSFAWYQSKSSIRSPSTRYRTISKAFGWKKVPKQTCLTISATGSGNCLKKTCPTVESSWTKNNTMRTCITLATTNPSMCSLTFKKM